MAHRYRCRRTSADIGTDVTDVGGDVAGCDITMPRHEYTSADVGTDVVVGGGRC